MEWFGNLIVWGIAFLVDWGLTIALGVITVVALWRIVNSYVRGENLGQLKKATWHLVVVCFLLGVIPNIPEIVSGFSDSLSKPAEAIMTYVSEEITNSVNESVGK